MITLTVIALIRSQLTTLLKQVPFLEGLKTKVNACGIDYINHIITLTVITLIRSQLTTLLNLVRYIFKRLKMQGVGNRCF
jgi:hypothetical protein